ncbi:MAG: CCA tRNA nucleotidyltransferase, partial [Spirochaetes bacterium]|nr:CCA tRNA nucleotidyltransferase [Spirochaetota bacterium]
NVYGSIEEDALRRDFTVNALYYNGADSSILDYTGGLKDLKDGVLRSIGDPAARFAEDPVRMIRAARFCAQLGFRPSRKDLKAALACASLITNANEHRMLEELYKILRCGASAGTFENLERFGILRHWLADLVSGDYRNDLLRRLAALDARRRKGIEVPAAVMLTVLMYDVFSREIGEGCAYQDAFSALHQRFTGMASGLRIPRREWDAVCNIIARQSSFARIPEGKRGKAFEKRFIRNAHFRNSFAFFEILSEASGTRAAELAYWRRKAVDAEDTAPHRTAPPRPASRGERQGEQREPVDAAATPGRSRRRRKRR